MTTTNKKRDRRRTLPEGFKWVQAVPVPEDTHRGFASRCAAEGLDRLQVLRTLVELYASGDLGTVSKAARERLNGAVRT